MTSSEKTVRTFIAVDISPEARQTLQGVARRFRLEFPQGVAWTNPQGFHVTLKFLGNISPDLVGRVMGSLTAPAAAANSFHLGLAGLGMFPNSKRPRVLWAGLNGDLAGLSALYLAVGQSLTTLGFAPEDRLFSPHITLGRVKRGASVGLLSKISGSVTAAPQPHAHSWQVESVCLFRTDLHPSGAEHTVIGSWPLGTPDTPVVSP